MSVCLALDTATAVATVALGDDQDLLAEVTLGRRRAGAQLVPAIEECLQLGGVGWRDVTEILIADGPGSFTGLRIGFATVFGIITEHDLRVSVAPSLMVSAWAAAQLDEAPVAALYDALRGEVFGALYSFTSNGVEVHEAPTLTTVARLRERARVRPRVAVGDGAVAYADEIRAWTMRDPLGLPHGVPRAFALLALRRLEGGAAPVDFEDFEPTYGRQAHAQAVWERDSGPRLGN